MVKNPLVFLQTHEFKIQKNVHETIFSKKERERIKKNQQKMESLLVQMRLMPNTSLELPELLMSSGL